MTIYKERACGRWQYWTYLDGERHYVSADFVVREMARGARLVHVA